MSKRSICMKWVVVFVASVASLSGHKRCALPCSIPEVELGYSVEAGLLLEKVGTSNNGIVRIQNKDPFMGVIPSANNFITDLNFDLDPGVRVSLSKYMHPGCYVLSIDFEYFHSLGSFSRENESSNDLNPIRMVGIYAATVILADSDFKTLIASLGINYYMINGLLEKQYYFSKQFKYSTLVGIKASWIDFNMSQQFSNDTRTAATRIPDSDSWMRKENAGFWGVGPLTGLKYNYLLVNGWGLFGYADIALLAGKSSLADNLGLVSGSAFPTTHSDHYTTSIVCGTIRNLIGLQYATALNSGGQHFCIKLGFDIRSYFNPYLSFKQAGTTWLSGSELNYGPQEYTFNSFSMMGLLFDASFAY